jgi:rhodanese-related sulfurtransferase
MSGCTQIALCAGAAPEVRTVRLSTRNPVKFIIDNWMILSVALASGAMLLWPALSGGVGGGLTAAAAVQLINREKAVVIDVCEASEFAAGHVGGAKSVPLGELAQKLPTTVKNKAIPVILVCQSGARSGRAVAIAKKLGYENAQSLSGGLGAWRAANLPVEKA